MEKKEEVINVGALRLSKERLYFSLSFLFATFVWFYIISGLFDPTIYQELQSGESTDIISEIILYTLDPLFLMFVFLSQLFSHFMALAYIRLNAVKVGEKQLPEIWDIVK